jgi:hypothetical protein
MVITIVILIGYGIWFYPKPQYNQAPKTIWTYWEEPDHLAPEKRLSKGAKECIQSWRTHNPQYEITILTKKTYQGYVTIPEELRTHPGLNPDYLSDLIKVWILAERGGIWIDPWIELDQPIDRWIFPRYGECALIDPFDPCLIACNKGSILIKKWRDEFSEIVRYPNVDQYVDSRRRSTNVDQIEDPIANVVQVAAQQMLQDYPPESLILHKDAPIIHRKPTPNS